MSDRLQELTVFVRAAESGSFSKAARELGLSQPSVSRIIGDLETRLGVKLLLRTTRSITVTDAGALFLTRAREVLADIEDAEDAARGVDSLRGTLRITMPIVYGTRNIIPRLPKFLKAHPLLRVELSVADERQNLVVEGTDVAIRLGPLDDSGFGARKLATVSRFLVAAPSYLAERGTPKTPADLASHDCIFGPGLFGRTTWSFTRNGAETSVDVRGRITTDSGPGVFASVLAGLGIAMTSPVMAGPEIEAGALVPVLKSYKLAPVEVYAVFPAGPRPSTKVRTLVDFLAEELR
ncbi:DNA-binding transcriptional LysR family regulator [Bradyrhizobium sp. JR7.2]|jgi:DNA-binding transcriptional LysR family regulator|uniref:LysR substrate-binding domain-containing protein n=1 Tax=Bradyrhizobium barranii TaxID=2992140 RepID=A0ABY3QL92_9BRAD|nr:MULTISPECIES: LysR family transcriptional regulator [Bradyrhizobium]UFW86349.1 LysR substrate-binding domain-containing protein [Bradyrhizobium japonicum]WFT94810.1 LysR substrate-binding domain-containing protein [Bradyrhizobium barranii]CUU21844.1 Transcriptional regulator LysR family CDS [Bradyrhizobium sp.]